MNEGEVVVPHGSARLSVEVQRVRVIPFVFERNPSRS
jgi:hypothetical protein